MTIECVAHRAAIAAFSVFLLTTACSRTAQDVAGPAPGAAIGDLELDPQAVVIGEGGTVPDRGPDPFYPLVVGYHWDYDGSFSITTLPPTGEPTTTSRHATSTHDLMCSSTAGGNTYVAERQLSQYDSGDAFTMWVVYRQDQLGLYEVDDAGPLLTCGASTGGSGLAALSPARGGRTSLADRAWERRAPSASPAQERWLERAWARQRLLHQQIRAALGIGPNDPPRFGPQTGVLPGEITRLHYPMHAGQHWTIRADPRFESRVVARQMVRTPAGTVRAYKIRITSELFGPDDRVYEWYGRIGYVGLIADLEDQGTDEAGSPARLISQQREILAGYQLQPAAAAVAETPASASYSRTTR